MSLTDYLIARISTDGPLSIADYMTASLLHPEFGYYATRDPFGAAGDFTTAPEISQMFGELAGLCLAQAWMDRGGAAQGKMLLVEPGPGRGTLMADMLRVLAKVPNLTPEVHLIEASAHLKAVQRATLSGVDVTWHDTVSSLPQGPVYMVANEFLDALPIRQFVREGEMWRERQVGVVEGKLAFGLAPPSFNTGLRHVEGITPQGGMVELCPAASGFASDIATRIAAAGGVAIFIDYGGWVSQGDTLQALRDHAPVDPLSDAGSADLTAHVDFERIAAAASHAGAQVSPLLTQGAWLRRLGIDHRAQALAAKLQGDARADHLAAHHRLTDSAEMGQLFKVLAIHATGTPPVPAFETPDPAFD
ncbi:class I SAM-dependent methyltransferase [Albirhodobacter sp. R86504]|uniref:class I SAM-dependent methyltransferase n=1 Tax=Albirhodobacter sp. R86504 TaxID=3093848 RepID=UPI00366DC21F